MKNNFKNIAFSKLVLWLLFITMIWSFFGFKRWNHAETNQKIICWDVTFYYGYLPATFIYHDISLEFTKRGDDKTFEEKHQFWYQTAPNGNRVNKFAMGMSILYLPFFLIAHASAYLFGFEANGFSDPYEFFIALSSIVYLFIGLVYLRNFLRLFYSEVATGISLFCILLGTNLYYYTTTEPAMSHAYSFAIIAVFIYQIIQWHSTPNYKKSIIIGLLLGLIFLIRPINIIIFLFPLLYNVYSKQTLIDKINFLFTNRKHLLTIAFFSFLAISPQLIYWKYFTGEWFFYSYMQEHFYFNNPHILLGLFSFRNGWLIYTPIMILSLIGIIFLSKNNKRFFFPILFFTAINIFLCYSWWTWWYAGSYGSRPMIDSYALLAIPLATFLEYFISKSKILFATLLAVLVLLVSLNLFQTYQRRNGIIHWDSMTAKAYQKVFLKYRLSNEDKIELDPLLYHPDYDKARKGEGE